VEINFKNPVNTKIFTYFSIQGYGDSEPSQRFDIHVKLQDHPNYKQIRPSLFPEIGSISFTNKEEKFTFQLPDDYQGRVLKLFIRRASSRGIKQAITITDMFFKMSEPDNN